MLYRKTEQTIIEHLRSDSKRVLVVTGARQVGKSYIIRHVGNQLFTNVIEINLIKDFEGDKLFEKVNTTDDFYFTLGLIAGNRLGNVDNTLIFLDEIQQYPHLLTMLKFLKQENRYEYIVSGSLLGVTLKQSTSIPIGSIRILRMYPLDFEEFLIANNISSTTIANMRASFDANQSLPEAIHNKILSIFKRYLLVGGMPDAVNAYLETRNIVKVREIHRDIKDLYAADASQYDMKHKLKISRIYNLVPSNLENKKKRLVFKDIDGKSGKRAADYEDEIDYLISSGITLGVKAISNPVFPLQESEYKNLVKLYFNDVGILAATLYSSNVTGILNDEANINLGSIYECLVAMELIAADNILFYYDNRTRGEVDFLINDYNDQSVIPIEVKSGKDYKRHSALTRFISNPDYNIKRGFVLSNNRIVETINGITYIPIYYTMFLCNRHNEKILI